ncbi:aromatic ring-opening dioxygenase LigA [Agromyces sp. SYSU T00194]|uniref:aromatic ring-opening dioxygenase LigA n=1 Tax=Agromyces chitinivorans TaxID=3158560 RepID=UPI003397FB76
MTTTISPVRRTTARVLSIIAIAIGAVFVTAGAVAWTAVSTQLADEQIVVAEDAAFLAGEPVAGPLTAYAQADIINHHALEASNGLTYAELDRDDPVRATMMNASFLRASLFTSVVSFGVALFAVGTGVVTILLGSAGLLVTPAAAKVEEAPAREAVAAG